jgi:hypothetical protein
VPQSGLRPLRSALPASKTRNRFGPLAHRIEHYRPDAQKVLGIAFAPVAKYIVRCARQARRSLASRGQRIDGVAPVRAHLYGGKAMTAPIFISFAVKDRDAAHTICEALENRGFNCWVADRDIGPGENFQIATVHAIRAAKVMILVFSANSNNSDEIKKEVVLAGQSRLVVIPVRVEDVTPDEAFAYELATRQWIDFFEDWERSIQRLVRQLETVAGIRVEPGDAAATMRPAASFGRSATGSKFDWRLIGFPVASVVVLIIAAGLWFALHNGKPIQTVTPNPPATTVPPATVPPASAPPAPRTIPPASTPTTTPPSSPPTTLPTTHANTQPPPAGHPSTTPSGTLPTGAGVLLSKTTPAPR